MRASKLFVVALLAAVSVGALLPGRATGGKDIVLNGSFDHDVQPWELSSSSDVNTLTFASNQDAGGDPNSGAAEVSIFEEVSPPSTAFGEGLRQCVPTVPNELYDAQAMVRIPSVNQFTETESRLWLFWFSNPNCAGAFVDGDVTPSVGISDSWQQLALTKTAPVNGHSAFFRMDLVGQDPAGPARSYGFFDDAMLLGSLGPLPGDVDCSRAITSIDALLVLQFDVALTGALPCQQHADVDESGAADAIDAVLILQFQAALVQTLPP